jgi:hypothetical protein
MFDRLIVEPNQLPVKVIINPLAARSSAMMARPDSLPH